MMKVTEQLGCYAAPSLHLFDYCYSSSSNFSQAVKNEAELKGCAEAHVVDGVALVKFIR